MYNTLEKLNKKFEVVFKKNVSLNEITVLSIQNSKTEAIVITNRFIYHLKKWFFTVKCNRMPCDSLKDIKKDNISLTFTDINDQKIVFSFSNDKVNLISEVYRIIKNLKI